MSEDKKISHIADHRPKVDGEDGLVERIAEALDMKLAQHFQQQNKVLMKSIGRLVGELDGVRTGKADKAFARVAAADQEADDLPRVEADSALQYPYTAEEIGDLLGLSHHEVGILLGEKGLNWAGNADYQEMSRYKPGRQKFWHESVPQQLKEFLVNPPRDKMENANVRIMAIVRKYRRAKGLADIVPISAGGNAA
ncbi:MAG TPA: hypothetical protein VGF92_19880 [Stellaceae bacterium]|jgi:hypothetical protein